jgi:enamine deaminase RidA (YjgF/YER057c/UK114 family)
MVAKRQTIQVPGRGRVHSPVPEGIKVGDFIFSSLLGPVGPNREQGANVAEDAALLFQRIRDLVLAGGGTPEDIVDMSVYVFDDNDRDAINREWPKMFPDPEDRPARHILNVSPHGTHWRFAAQFTAIVRAPSASTGGQGNLVFSPLLIGRLPGSHSLPSDPQAQAEALFQQVRIWVESAGGTIDNVVDMMVYLMGDEYRAVINKSWAKMFPDRTNLPARQTLVVTPAGLEEGLFAAAVKALL